MPLAHRPYRRFLAHCAVTYNTGPFLKPPLAYFSGLDRHRVGPVSNCLHRFTY